MNGDHCALGPAKPALEQGSRCFPKLGKSKGENLQVEVEPERFSEEEKGLSHDRPCGFLYCIILKSVIYYKRRAVSSLLNSDFSINTSCSFY